MARMIKCVGSKRIGQTAHPDYGPSVDTLFVLLMASIPPAEHSSKQMVNWCNVADTKVLIAGGGPVGLVLAHTLAFYGVQCVIVERNASTTRHPKMDLTNSRSVELLAKLRLKEILHNVAVPAAHPLDVAWVTQMSGHELYRFVYPSIAEMERRIRENNDGSMPAEASVRVSQILLEPALKNALDDKPGVSVRFGCALESFEPSEDGVVCAIRQKSTDSVQTITAQYLVGCDGGGSLVRKRLGIPLEGNPAMRTSYMIHFRSKAYDVLQRWGIAWHYQSNRCTLVAQDDKEYWTLHTRIPPGVDAATVDPHELLRSFLGCDIDCEILVAEPWQAHLVVAERYSAGSVYLAGDAAHQFVPTGGYGMNTGVGDAFDLGWKLAATLQGWGGSALLESYDLERRPVGLRNREASRANVGMRFQIDDLYTAAGKLEGDAADAQSNRAALSARLREIGNPENERWGVEYGYIYSGSPVICYDDKEPLIDESLKYIPTTQPGARLPSSVLKNGDALYGLLGPWFTLLAFQDGDIDALEAVAAKMRIPLTVLRISDPDIAIIYKDSFLLVRPDHHIAWRGDQLPEDSQALLAKVSGRAGVVPRASSEA